LRLDFKILPQPDDTTCGPTCLQAVYAYYGEHVPLERVIAEIPQLETGGTLGVILGKHALQRGYRALLQTYNLEVFDPTWFADPAVDIEERLRAQLEVKSSGKLALVTRAYLDYLQAGGRLGFGDLTPTLLRQHLKRKHPILTGLSATWLYRSAREIGPPMRYDDVRGEPTGHFVVLVGYEPSERAVFVADPLLPNPVSPDNIYSVEIDRLVNAILLGISTYDGNLLILTPPRADNGT
jgi:hypothetical protein